MAITALTLMKLSDTFNTLKDRINEIITKINTTMVNMSQHAKICMSNFPLRDQI